MLSTPKFRKIVRDFYKKEGRHTLPWRQTEDPYKVLVSEVMLQQTQVERVIPFYAEFMRHFPTVRALAGAKPVEVLKAWQGLGYNRRAINLQRAAQIVVEKYKGTFPALYSELIELPGVGPATAGDLLAFAYNQPAVVVETNIRTVFIHHFFIKDKVHDKELLPLIEQSLDREHPRDWYYALMDYGAYLKKHYGNNVAKSAHYAKQSKFKGSNRERRSKLLRLMLKENRPEKDILKLLNS